MKTLATLFVLLAATVLLGQDCDQGIVRVQIANIAIETVHPIDPSVLSQIAQNIKDKVTDACQVPDELSERLRDKFQQRGYFKVLVKRPVQVKQVGGTDTDQTLDVVVRVDEGAVYRLDHIAFTHNTVFPFSLLRSLVPIKDGEIFNIEKVREGVHDQRDLYGSHGYFDFTPVPNTDFNDEHASTVLTFDLDEGEQYRIGNLTLAGQEPFAGAGKKLQEAWQPLVGQVYDYRLLEATFNSIYRLPGRTKDDDLLSTAVRATGVIKMETRQRDDTHTVDFLFEFPSSR